MGGDRTNQFGDARVEELAVLAHLARGPLEVGGFPQASPERAMYAALIESGCVNFVDSVTWSFCDDNRFHWARPDGVYRNNLHQRADQLRWQSLNQLLGGQPLRLEISHRGRVRLSELEQQIKAGREREKFGILLDGRHLERGVAVALTKAKVESPVAIAFLDMNGLKAVNDTMGHHAGDEAIKRYFQALAAVTGPTIEGYSRSGDEVVLVCEGMDAARLSDRLAGVLKKLMTEVVEFSGQRVKLSASCGIAATTNYAAEPGSLLQTADTLMYAAKAETKKQSGESASAIAREGAPVAVLTSE